jgi:hypothetical protein
MLDLLSKFKSIIEAYRIISYDHEIDAYRIKAEIRFINGSALFVKEYYFGVGGRKYSFHWADRSGNLLCRWDNAPHWVHVSTFPHHKHLSTGVVDSRETTLEEILFVINKKLSLQQQPVVE